MYNMNCFKILKQPEIFNLNLTLIEQNYLELIKLSHPDYKGNIAKSSNINFAYKTLLSPLLRAKHLLKLNNINNINTNLILLKQSLQDREILERYKHPKQLINLKKDTNSRIKYTEKLLNVFFKNRKKYLNNIHQQIYKLSYYYKYYEIIEETIYKLENNSVNTN